jgi:hypothetical protein
MTIIEDLEVEVKRAKDMIAHCEATPTTSIAARWLRALVLQSERAIRDRNVIVCIRCLRQLREVKG